MQHAAQINVVLACDAAFCMPLAVTIRSLLNHGHANRYTTIWILHDSISHEIISMVNDSVRNSERYCNITWIPVDRDTLADASADGHVSIVTYFRILIGRYLPQEVQRVIYLDCDVVVRKDLSELFDSNLEGRTIAAVQDTASPFLDARQVLSTRCLAIRHLGATRPIPNYRQLNLPAESPYFNAGVMLIDLKRWRENQVEAKLLNCIREHRDNMIWWDQYALNVILHNDWKKLDPAWNVTSHLMALRAAKQCYLDETTFDRIRRDPNIVHFSSDVKPWHALCNNPFRNDFEKILDETHWSGTRPSKQQRRRDLLMKIMKTPRRLLGRFISGINPWHQPLPHQL